jgi:Glyoxalase/Bleomycin resistance protein/Dioxygenase superfamily
MNGLGNPLYEQEWPEGEYRLFQLGFVVDDLIATATRWALVHGVGPFHVLPVVEQEAVVRGRASPVSIQVGVAQAGPVQIELIRQHCDRPSIYREWTRNGTRAFHQVATVTADYDAKKAHLVRHGYELAAESLAGRFRVAYFNTVADFGFYTEVVEETPGFLAQLSRISETCATWDGTDPVRLLTRDGYRVPEA